MKFALPPCCAENVNNPSLRSKTADKSSPVPRNSIGTGDGVGRIGVAVAERGVAVRDGGGFLIASAVASFSAMNTPSAFGVGRPKLEFSPAQVGFLIKEV